MRVVPEAMAPSIRARCEMDLSPGTRSRPAMPVDGSTMKSRTTAPPSDDRPRVRAQDPAEGSPVLEIGERARERFGGGVPLSIKAGANFPKWILQELQGQEPLIENNKNLKKLFKDLPSISEKIQTSGWDLMGQAGRLRLSGLVTVLLSIFTLFCRPRWVGLIALPFGLYSLKLSMILM